MRSPIGLLLLLAAAARLGAQDSPPTPPPPVIPGGVELVRVDVVVTDGDGRHIPDLQAEEFAIEEDGRPRVLAALRYVTRGRPASGAPATPGVLPAAPPAPAGPAGPEPLEVEPRAMAIVVDDTSFSNVSRVRAPRMVRHVIRKLATPDTPLFIMRTGEGPNRIQDFTTDTALQEAVVAHLRPSPAGGEGLRGEKMEAEQSVQRTLQVLRGLQTIVEGLAGRPGRTALLLITEGLPLETAGGRGDGGVRVLDALRQLTDTANRGRVTISVIDPSGLQSERYAAADFFDQGASFSAPFDSAALRETLSAHPARTADVRRQLERGPLQLAQETGGLALSGNDLNGAAERVWNDQDGYYLIGYEPEAASVSSSDEGVEHEITVRVKRKGLTVRSRRVYYAGAAAPDPAVP